MALFGGRSPMDPRFELPKVSSRECTELRLPRRSVYAMANHAWTATQWEKGIAPNPAEMVIRIFDSEVFWERFMPNVEEVALAIAVHLASTEAMELDVDQENMLFQSARFGMLAGMFDHASETTEDMYCHPEIWNARSYYSTFARERYERKSDSETEDIFLMNCDKASEAGLVMGKIGGISVMELFEHWGL